MGHLLPALGHVLLRKNMAQICWNVEEIRALKQINLKYRQESAGEFLVRYYDLFYNGKIDKKHR
ncbi:hypothetical protein GCM10008922_35600 [Faecalicatena contorta]